MKLLILSAQEVVRALPMTEAIEGMKIAFAQLSAGKTSVPLRNHIDVPAHQGVALVMPAYLHETGELAVKLVSVFPQNPQHGLPVINGVVLALDVMTGLPLALMDGATVTAIRTGAASGAATDLLARPEARTVAIFGSGVQARTQLEAVCAVRDIEQVWVYSPNPANGHQLAMEMAGRGRIPPHITVATTPAQAACEADIICTATSSAVPVFAGADVRPGTHINAVGTFRTTMREVDSETVCRALVVVDERASAWAEAGDLVIPLEAGEIEASHIYAELGEIAAGQKEGRISAEQITLFKSVGNAVQDAIATGIVLRNAAANQLGIYVNL